MHLESLSTQPTREEQLERIAGHLRDSTCRGIALGGDFNFDCCRNFSPDYTKAEDGLDEESRVMDWEVDEELDNDCLARLLPDYVDTWRLLHPADRDGNVRIADRGFTFDTVANRMVSWQRAGYGYEQMRYDRIMTAADSPWRPALIELVGTEPVPNAAAGCDSGEREPCWPSDHFGLLLELRLVAAGASPTEHAVEGVVVEGEPIPQAPHSRAI